MGSGFTNTDCEANIFIKIITSHCNISVSWWEQAKIKKQKVKNNNIIKNKKTK